MKLRLSWTTLALLAMLAVVGATDAPCQAPAAKPGGAAKPKGKPGNPLDVKRLDARLDEVRESFLRETTTLILSYENLGQYERARTLLESLQRLDPRNEPVRAKIGELNAKIVERDEFDVDLDPGASWQPIGAVAKDRMIRIRATGEYKLTAALALGPDGVPTANLAEDLVPTAPLGAVVGVIAPAGGFADSQGDRPPRPFAVGGGYEKPADRDGVLYLKVNAPAGTKCAGKLSVKVSGPEKPAP
ncbi:MAG: hypothetical protein ACKOHK_08210 [Planctomycetia bacterium]